MAENTEWIYLIGKFISNSCTREEFDRLMSLVESGDEPQGLSEQMRKHWDSIQKDEELSPEWSARLTAMFNESPGFRRPGRFRGMLRSITRSKWAAAAVIILMVGAGYFGWYAANYNAKTGASIGKTAKQGVGGVNRATLLLADGSYINLDTAQNGTIAIQGNVKIIKGEEGEIIYYPDRQQPDPSGYNTIITPNGGRYRVVLPDGTKVWMNAASSMKFPTDFVGDTRDIDLSGEAYFEVRKNPEMPFNVRLNGANVSVLGTSFNISAYSEEKNVATTVIEGSVKVFNASASKEVILKPGQQVKVNKEDDALSVSDSVDIDQALAWKNGKFLFVNQPIPELLREVGRWYGLRVVYQGEIASHKHLTGTFSRSMKLDQLTEMLRYAGVNITVQNDTLLIRPN